MRPAKKKLNKYPPHGTEVPAYDFVMDENVGLPGIIDYLNLWAREADRVEDLLIIRYEDMRTDPGAVLARVMEFAGSPPTNSITRASTRTRARSKAPSSTRASRTCASSRRRTCSGSPADA